MKTYEHRGPSGGRMRMRRLLALLLDVIICALLGLFIYGLLWICLGFSVDEIFTSFRDVVRGASFFYLTPFFFKDIFGRSIGKVVFGLYIVENNSNKIASPGKRFFRNFSMMLFPLEGIALLISETNTRLADKLLEIQVVRK